jgi:hypothetical protein
MSPQVPAQCRELVQLQAGVLSRKQALDSGMAPDVIDRRLRSGRWQALQRGVYSIYTGKPSREVILWAAVHRAGTGAARSHQTAAELFKIVDQPSAVIHLTIPEYRRASHRTAASIGAVLHSRGWPGPARPCGPACPVGRPAAS